MSLLEVSVVLAVLLALTSVLIIGSRAWKSSADRTGCILQIRDIQMSVRTYQNIYGYSAGSMPYAENGTQDIAIHLYSKGYINPRQFAAAIGVAPCMGGGAYARTRPDVFPAVGTLYLSCSLSDSRAHRLDADVEW